MNSYIFREYDIRGVVGEDLTPDVVNTLGKGIGSYLRRNEARKISIGYDGRLSSVDICNQLSEGLRSTGIDLVNLGVIPTPLSYYSTHVLEVDGSVMITGSHNPPEYNGFKVSLGTDTIFGEEIQKIRKLIEAEDFEKGSGGQTAYDIKPEYMEDVRNRIKLDRPVKVAVDAGNGVSGLVAQPLLESLGCQVEMLYDDVDGNFPNHHPDPTVEANLADLKEKVVQGGFEAGFAYDGDGDRIGMVSESGEVIWGDQILAILARDVLRNKPGACVIGEVKCSQLLFDDIERHGGKPLMWKVGHSLIKRKMHETGAEIAGEMSGHIFFHNRYYGFDDALYVTGRMLEIISRSEKTAGSMLDDWPELFNTPEIRKDCPDKIKFQVVEKVRDYFREKYEVVDVDGMRVKMPGGWGLLRASNTQPVVVLRFEADSQDRLNDIQQEVERVLDSIAEECKDSA